MIEKIKKISKFKNKDYFNQLLSKHNLWNKKIDKKHTFLNFMGLISLIAIFLSCILFVAFENSFFIYLLVTGAIALTLTMVAAANNLITRNENKQIENLNGDLIKNLKENQSILQDLAELAVDEKSKIFFLQLTDIALSDVKDSDPLEKLLSLLRHYPDPLDTFSYQEKRDKALKNLNIVLDIEKELPKEIETKQKLLEML